MKFDIEVVSKHSWIWRKLGYKPRKSVIKVSEEGVMIFKTEGKRTAIYIKSAVTKLGKISNVIISNDSYLNINKSDTPKL